MAYVYRGKKPGRKPKAFDSYVERTESCWLWRGAVNATGYGSYRFNGKPRKAHHIAYLLSHGSLPESGSGRQAFVVMHTCDNRLCVNPAHLVLGTQFDNIADRVAKGRSASRATNNRWNKLSPEDVSRIREAYLFGGRRSDLASMYDVTWSTIDRIVRPREAQQFL